MLPLFCRKATWAPSGALGLFEVKALPLLLAPADPENSQGEPLGAYWKVAAVNSGASKLLSLTGLDGAMLSIFRPSRSSKHNRRGAGRLRAVGRNVFHDAPDSVRRNDRNMALSPSKERMDQQAVR